MEIEILEERENPLFKRKELTVQISHWKEATPTREAFRKKISALKNANLDTIVIREIKSTFGIPRSDALVHIYETSDLVLKTEPVHILKRNNLIKPEEPTE
ncbi:MAG: 30S ribosomal protein S24e [Candidatus Heimdallarchaeota archaeon]